MQVNLKRTQIVQERIMKKIYNIRLLNDFILEKTFLMEEKTTHNYSLTNLNLVI